MYATIRKTHDNYLILDGYRLCRVDGDELVFFDRKPSRRKRRELQTGEADVRVKVLDLVKAAVGKL